MTTITWIIRTVDGSTQKHSTRYEDRHRAEQGATEFLANAAEVIRGGDGMILMSNPTAVYNVTHIVSIQEAA